jgi:hypothetical protein
LEVTGSLKWKILKDLQVKSDVFLWDGSTIPGSRGQPPKTKAVADLNLGAEFTVMPRLNLWIQMNNLLNSTTSAGTNIAYWALMFWEELYIRSGN